MSYSSVSIFYLLHIYFSISVRNKSHVESFSDFTQCLIGDWHTIVYR